MNFIVSFFLVYSLFAIQRINSPRGNNLILNKCKFEFWLADPLLPSW